MAPHVGYRTALALVLIAWLGALAPARAADAAPQGGVLQALDDRLFRGIQKLVQSVAQRLSKSDDVEITINSIEKDARNRMYIDLDGDVEMKFPLMPRKLSAYMEGLPGHHVQSDGPINVDYTVSVAEATGEKSWHVAFHARLILVLEEVLAKMVRFGSTVVGTVTLMGIGKDLADVIDGINGEALSGSLHEGLRHMGEVMAGLAGVETFDAWRGFRSDRDHIDSESGTATVMAHLAVAVIHGAFNVATSFAGMSVGAALGTALFPGVGSTVGALVGAAGFTLVGNIVYKKLTVDLPISWRLARIRRMTQAMQASNRQASNSPSYAAFLAAAIERHETKIVKRFALELRTDKFTYFDELVQRFKSASPADRAYYAGLRDKLESSLKFEVLNRGDRLFAWKMNQLRDAFGDAPIELGAR